MNMREAGSAAYQIALLVLSFYVLIALVLQELLIKDPEVKMVLQYADFFVCLLFLADFFVNLYRAENKIAYMKWGWIDLISSIPAVDPLRWGRVARVIRIIRFFRALRSVRVIWASLRDRKAETLSLVVFLSVFFIYTICSALILHFEHQVGGEIVTAKDALWWSFLNILNAKISLSPNLTSATATITVILNKVGVMIFAYINAMFVAWLISSRTDS